MSDRIQEIRGRLDGITDERQDIVGHGNATFIAHAPADIAYLLAEVERLRAELAEAQEAIRKDGRVLRGCLTSFGRDADVVLMILLIVKHVQDRSQSPAVRKAMEEGK